MARKVNQSELIKKYALALYQEAVMHNQTDKIADELHKLKQIMLDCPEFNLLVTSHQLNENQRQSIISVVSDKLELSDLMYRFLAVLNSNSRMCFLEQITSSFMELYEEQNGILSVDVVSAQILNEQTIQHLTDVLKKIFNKEIRLNLKTNPSLIGGLTVQVGSVMADASVKTKLQKLNLVMKGVVA